MTAILYSPRIGPVAIDVVISESHESELEITEIPVEFGAAITDHAYSLPQRVTLEIATNNAATSYQALKAWQKARVPFTIVTGLDVYSNMLIKSLSPTRNDETSNILSAKVSLQEIIIAGSAQLGGLGGLGSIATGLLGGMKSLTSGPLSAITTLGGAVQNMASTTAMRGMIATSAINPAAGTTASGKAKSILSKLGRI